MNHFEFFGLQPQILLDEKVLKTLFLQNSKKYHPDFYTLSTEEEQEKILELATKNTEAYKQLSNFESRLAYVLSLKNMLKEEGQEKMPAAFLMEMMDINEALMELEFDFDAQTFQQLQNNMATLEKNDFDEIFPILQTFDFETVTKEDLEKIKIFYLKSKYYLRIRKTCSTFAPQ
jgi:molecular chaperone HscB